MAELGSTGGNLDNILQYLLQRIEKSGIAEGGTGGGGTTNLDNYYTKAEVNNLITGYATETWVKAQGYLTSANLKGYATEKWVEGKGYLTSDALKGYAKTTDIQKDYVNKTAFETFKSGYDNLAAAVNAANATAQGYAKTALAEAKSYADGKFVTKAENWEVIDGIKMLNGTYTFFKTLYIEPETSYGAYIGWRDGPAVMNILTNGRIMFRQGIQDNIELYGGIEIFDTMPYIDFHYGNSTADFTSRIIESASGVLELFSSSYNPGTLKIGNAYITYDSKNNALMVSDGSGGAVNIVAMGDVAAFGGLGSGFDTLTDLKLTNKLTAKSASITEALTAGGINVTGAKEGYINLARGNIEDCYQITGDEIYANDFFYLGSNKISQISASGNETSGYVVKITLDGKTYAMDAIMLT